MSNINKPIIFQTLENIWNSKLLTSCLLCLSVTITNAALAEYKRPQNTQNDAPGGESTIITGVRGAGSCSEQATTKLTALAPYSHLGQTASSYPTFAWYIPDTNSYPIKFRLYEYDPNERNSRGKVIVREELSSSPGIMTYSLPSDSPGLTVGKKYIWQVVAVCNPNSPSRSLVISAEIKVVEQPNEIVTELNNTNDSIAKADIYAEAGLWYDALAEVVTVPDNSQAQLFTTELLRQLAEIERQDNANDLDKISEAIETNNQHQQQLEKIVEALRNN